jgi:hypothetical protein
MTSPKAEPAFVTTDLPYEVCRAERCPIMGMHEAHDLGPVRGRAPKLCPDCGAPTVKEFDPKAPTRLIDCHCSACPWRRV